MYFNFHYLPLKQAIKLPILLYKPKLLKMNGSVVVSSKNIRFGMIRLGTYTVPLYPNSGILWENNGGTVYFDGRCKIGNNSKLSIGKLGILTFGDNFLASTSLKLACCNKIVFKENVRLAWDVIVIDTSFHRLKDMAGNYLGKGYGEIIIGRNNWIPTRCTVLKGTRTPDYCIFGCASLLNKDYTDNPTHILMAGNPLTLKREGIWRDVDDDSIEY
jgi:Acetyltransferase (isoleucine patch superfamily)